MDAGHFRVQGRTMTEKRREPRKRTFLKGRIVFNSGSSSMECLVRDMSASGARIALDETMLLPEHFTLEIPQKDRTFTAALRWRHEDGVGVLLDADAEVRDDLARLRRRVAELETENRALRLRLGEANAPDGSVS
jgi:hypothetical protein